jgi:hypothetical protein
VQKKLGRYFQARLEKHGKSADLLNKGGGVKKSRESQGKAAQHQTASRHPRVFLSGIQYFQVVRLWIIGQHYGRNTKSG